MTHMLSLCPACRRHVHVDDERCPFCEHAGPRTPPRVRASGRGLTRAALFVAGASIATACGPDHGSVGEVYGGPPMDEPRLEEPPVNAPLEPDPAPPEQNEPEAEDEAPADD